MGLSPAPCLRNRDCNPFAFSGAPSFAVCAQRSEGWESNPAHRKVGARENSGVTRSSPLSSRARSPLRRTKARDLLFGLFLASLPAKSKAASSRRTPYARKLSSAASRPEPSAILVLCHLLGGLICRSGQTTGRMFIYSQRRVANAAEWQLYDGQRQFRTTPSRS
jgi:hypothetical protein